MSFSDWLNQVGIGISAVFSWVVDCINSLKDNYIILTIIGLSLFFYIFHLVYSLIRSFFDFNYYNKMLEKNQDKIMKKMGDR